MSIIKLVGQVAVWLLSVSFRLGVTFPSFQQSVSFTFLIDATKRKVREQRGKKHHRVSKEMKFTNRHWL